MRSMGCWEGFRSPFGGHTFHLLSPVPTQVSGQKEASFLGCVLFLYRSPR